MATPAKPAALKSGWDPQSLLIPGEDPNDFADLQQTYFAQYDPQTAEERFRVDTLVRCEWMLRRLFRAETEIWNYYSENGGIGQALAQHNAVFMRLQRRITLAEQAYEKALRELKALLAERPAAEQAAKAEEVEPEPCERRTRAFGSVLSQPLPFDLPGSPLALRPRAPDQAGIAAR